MTRTLLVGVSIFLSVFLYVPLFRRIAARRSTGDYSKLAQWCILGLQLSNGALAVVASAWWLVTVYAVNLLLVGATLLLIYRFYDEPMKRVVNEKI